MPPVFEGGVTKLTQLRQEFSRLGFSTSSLDGPDLKYSPSLLTAKSPLQSVTGLEDIMGLFSAMGTRKAGAASGGEVGASTGGEGEGPKDNKLPRMMQTAMCVTCDAVFQDMVSQIFDTDRNALLEEADEVCQTYIVPKVLKSYSIQKGNTATGFVLQDREGLRVSKEEAQAVVRACRQLMKQSKGSQKGDTFIEVLQKHMHSTSSGGNRFAATLRRRACQEVSACPQSPDKLILAEFSKNCLEVVHGWWSYEVCPQKHVKQVHREKNDDVGAQIHLGNFEVGSSAEVEHKIAKHLRAPGRKSTVQALSHTYEGGTMCEVKHEKGPKTPAGGISRKRRRTTVHYACSPTEKVYATVKENETCSYEIDVYLPSLCQMHGFGLD